MFICLVYKDFVKYAFICFMLSGICDMLDGFIARKCKRTDEEKSFGVELDSLVDVFSFIALPVIILISIGLNEWYNLAIFALFAICGVARLGYFNIITADSSKPVKYYEGLPVTLTALVFPLAYLLKLVLDSTTLNVVMTLITFIVAMLFVTRIKIKKPGKISYLIFGLIAGVVITLYCIYI